MSPLAAAATSAIQIAETASAPDTARAVGAQPPERERAGERVALVGDGVNDAAALQAASAGIAVYGGADVSTAAADIFLTRPGLHGLLELVRGAQRFASITRGAIAYALIYNALAITLAACGLITPLWAAVLMPLSSIGLLAYVALARSFDT